MAWPTTFVRRPMVAFVALGYMVSWAYALGLPALLYAAANLLLVATRGRSGFEREANARHAP